MFQLLKGLEPAEVFLPAKVQESDSSLPFAFLQAFYIVPMPIEVQRAFGTDSLLVPLPLAFPA